MVVVNVVKMTGLVVVVNVANDGDGVCGQVVKMMSLVVEFNVVK